MYFKLCLLILCLGNYVESKDIWIGTPPFCSVKSSYCDIFDLDYVTSDKNGDGYRCWTGHKVKCRTRNRTSGLVNTDSKRLTVLSYDIDNVPHAVKHNGQRERSCHIPRAIANQIPTVDVVVIQGSFTVGCWKKLTMLDLFGLYGFSYQTSILGDPPRFPKVINGGVLIVSRWPIIRSSGFVFNSYNTMHEDYIISKGATYAAIMKQGITYHVFGTDLQGGPGRANQDVRISQIYELRDFIQRLRISSSDLVIVAGYFHTDYLDCPGKVNDILRVLNVHLPLIEKGGRFPDGTMSPKENNLATVGMSTEWLDFITFSKQHRLPTNATMRAVKLVAHRRFPYCKTGPLQPFYIYPDDKLCLDSDTTYHLSDHFPVISEIYL